MAFIKDFKIAEGPKMQKKINNCVYTTNSLSCAVSFVFSISQE